MCYYIHICCVNGDRFAVIQLEFSEICTLVSALHNNIQHLSK